MIKHYLSKVCLAFCILLFVSFNVNGQCSATPPAAAACNTVTQNFNGVNGGFTSTSIPAFIHNNSTDQFFSATMSSGNTATLLSPAYSPNEDGGIVGFTVGNLTSTIIITYSIQVYNASTMAPLGTPCSGSFSGTGAVQVCASLNVPAVNAEEPVRYEISITASSFGGTRAFTLDDFSLGVVRAPLPVQLNNVKAVKENNVVKITWNAGLENDLAGYEVERSQNGIQFSKIGFIDASERSTYSFTDNAPLSGVNYYRIHTLDSERMSKYSYIVSANSHSLFSITRFPNPARNNLVIQHPSSSGRAFLRISSLDGRLVKQVRLPVNAAVTNIDISALKQGNYIIEFVDGKDKVVGKFLKQ